MRVIDFGSKSGELRLYGAFNILQSTRQIEGGACSLALTCAKEHYSFMGEDFCLLKGEGALSLEDCMNAPKAENIEPYFIHTNDRENRLLPCPNFERNLDRYLLKREGVLFFAQEVKGFVAFLKTMDSNTKAKRKVFEIAECDCLNRYLAQKVRKHKAKREGATWR
ncbi:MAG: hypothetical protein ACTTH5_03000 [Wolinella sp.]